MARINGGKFDPKKTAAIGALLTHPTIEKAAPAMKHATP